MPVKMYVPLIKGIQEGMHTEQMQRARKMLQKRESPKKVVEFTGLTKKELGELVREIGLS